MKNRLDSELVRRGLARSRENAADLIESRSVLVNGIPASKPATQVDAQTSIVIAGKREDFVSRGGDKLAGALDEFKGVEVNGVRALDAGASTGGFTDVLLKRGVKEVVAVDVGDEGVRLLLGAVLVGERDEVRAADGDTRVIEEFARDEVLHAAGDASGGGRLGGGAMRGLASERDDLVELAAEDHRKPGPLPAPRRVAGQDRSRRPRRGGPCPLPPPSVGTPGRRRLR